MYQAKTHVRAAVVGRRAVPVGRAAVPGTPVIAAAAQRPVLAVFRSRRVVGVFQRALIPVLAPLPGVAVHVEQAAQVGPQPAADLGPLVQVPAVMSEQVAVAAEAVRRYGASPAGIFPLRLGRQPEP